MQGKISATGVIRYCKIMCLACVVYLWGANVEVITKELFEGLKKRHGAKKYADIRFENVEGKLGADCSGFLYPLSGSDDTAAGYYSKCPDRGKISEMPRDKVCLIFRKEGGKIVHVAIYVGDGTLYEMWDGCEHRDFVEKEWTHYGIPDWIEPQTDKLVVGGTVTIAKALPIFYNAQDAKAGKNALKKKYSAGVYYVYKIDSVTGAVNITKQKGEKGAWVML